MSLHAFHLIREVWRIWAVVCLCLTLVGGEWLGFKTEPTLSFERFNIKTWPEDPAVLAPGYLFVDILRGKKGWGPQIYAMDGTPIWLGPSVGRSQNLHVCDFEGVLGTHLCYFLREDPDPATADLHLPAVEADPHGINVVLDNTYTMVRNYTRGFKGMRINGHAFNMLRGGDSWVSPLRMFKQVDLRAYGGDKHGWVRNACIEETDTRTGKSLFHWCYLESGLKMWETKTYFESDKQHTNATAHKFGAGTSERPWDFLHFNAVEKSVQGDYYISFRHGDQVIKIAGLNNPKADPGTLLWRLGGRSNDFKLEGFSFEIPFSRQHDVRTVYGADPGQMISLFNNAWDGALTPSQNYSEGQFISIDEQTMTARLVRHYAHPEGKLSKGRGSTQQLPNQNVLVGYGSVPEVSEFDFEGSVLYHAHFSQHLKKNAEFSYRVLKYPWKGLPSWPPKLVAYCRSCRSLFAMKEPLVAYASWNGATEVQRWRFFTASEINGTWYPAGSFEKTGFETRAKLIRFPSSPKMFRRYVRAEALSEDGEVLGSTVAKTFIPRPGLLQSCGRRGCRIKSFKYDDQDSMAWACNLQVIFGFAAAVFMVLYVESLVFIFENMILLRRFWL